MCSQDTEFSISKAGLEVAVTYWNASMSGSSRYPMVGCKKTERDIRQIMIPSVYAAGIGCKLAPDSLAARQQVATHMLLAKSLHDMHVTERVPKQQPGHQQRDHRHKHYTHHRCSAKQNVKESKAEQSKLTVSMRPTTPYR